MALYSRATRDAQRAQSQAIASGTNSRFRGSTRDVGGFTPISESSGTKKSVINKDKMPNVIYLPDSGLGMGGTGGLAMGTGQQSSYDNRMYDILSAQENAANETQRRAAEDRAKALGVVNSNFNAGRDVLSGVEGKVSDAMSRYDRGIEELANTPSINKDAIYGQARNVIEGQTADLKRRTQQGYYSGIGQPQGAMRAELRQADLAKTGQLASKKIDIETEAGIRERENKLEEINLAKGYAETLYGLNSDIAKSLASQYASEASLLADIYSNTIGAVPSYSNAYSATAGSSASKRTRELPNVGSIASGSAMRASALQNKNAGGMTSDPYKMKPSRGRQQDLARMDKPFAYF